jgi:hypothetical protein
MREAELFKGAADALRCEISNWLAEKKLPQRAWVDLGTDDECAHLGRREGEFAIRSGHALQCAGLCPSRI